MTPKLFDQNIQQWANRLTKYLDQVRSLLQFKTDDAKATQDGVLLWDSTNKYPVVSKDGEFRQVVLADGQCFCSRTTDVTAAAANTAYAITFDTTTASDGITVSGDTITFLHGGNFTLSFTAQVYSDSSSTKHFWFFPEINGTNATGSTIKTSIHDNELTTVVSRTALFSMAKNDTMRVMWAVSNTDGWLEAFPAESFAPATPAATLSIVRVSQ